MCNFLFACLTFFASLCSPLPYSYLNYTTTLPALGNCLAGTYSIHNTCKPCVAGSASSKFGATSITTCSLCPAGKCTNCLGTTTCSSAFTKKMNFKFRDEL